MKGWNEAEKTAAEEWEDSIMIAPEDDGGEEAQKKRDQIR